MPITSLGQRKRVALFGGSFNPPHVGHTAICKWIFQRGIAEEVWVVPCFIHPFGKDLAPFADRLAMAKLAFAKLNLPISVSDVEEQLGGESFTVRTIEHMVDLNPGVRFSLITGGDVSHDAKKWQRFDRIAALVDIVRIPRGPDSPIPDVSSTEIRRRIGAREDYKKMVEPEVAIYIVTKALYRNQ